MSKKTSARAKPPKSDNTPETSSIHTPLTLDDRDAVDLLRSRIHRHAAIVQHTLSTWDEDKDSYEGLDRETLESGLIALCASIVEDAGALGDRLEIAEKRGTDGAR